MILLNKILHFDNEFGLEEDQPIFFPPWVAAPRLLLSNRKAHFDTALYVFAHYTNG